MRTELQPGPERGHYHDTLGVGLTPMTELGLNQQQVQDLIDASVEQLTSGAPGALDTLNELAAALNDDANFATTVLNALDAKQPLDSDLTAIAALSTTAIGRSLLAAANEAAIRTIAGAEVAGAAAAAQAASQPLDSDLTAIAALSTTAFGRSLLEAADAAALRTLAGTDALYVAAAILTTAGDMIYRPGATNWATSGNGASASAPNGGNNGSGADVIDGNDSTFFNPFNFTSNIILIDLGQSRAVGGFRIVTSGATAVTIEYGSSSSGPWTQVAAPSVGGGSPNVTTQDITTVSARYWRFVPAFPGSSINWYTIEVLAAAVPTRLATTAVGRGLLNASQGAAIANATDATSVITQLNLLLAFLRTRGDIAT